MITQFDKNFVADIHREAAELLQQLAAKHGLKVRAAGGNFDLDAATLKFEFKLTSEEAERAAFNKHCELFGCKPEHYGREAKVNGVLCRLIGFDLRRRSFPIVCRNVVDKKERLFKEMVLRVAFKIAPEVSATGPIEMCSPPTA